MGLEYVSLGGDAELAKDLSQQAFVKAYRHLSNFNARHTSDNAQARHRFRNWLTGIAVNCFRDLVKTENRFQALNAGLEPKYHPVDNDSQGFFDLIKPLSNQERLIFTLRYIYEYNIEEIAQMTKIKPGTVKSKISRALQRLRDNSHE